MMTWSKRSRLGFALGGLFVLTPGVGLAAKTVCVDVQLKSWTVDAPLDSNGAAEKFSADGVPLPPSVSAEYDDPYAIDPARYLARVVSYEVTHHPLYEAVDKDCEGQLTVELYPLQSGWTVFARFSGHAREEKVPYVQLDEFDELATRVVKALLDDRPVRETIDRLTVLRADSEADLRTIRGEGHFLLALGTDLRVGDIPTASSSGLSDETRYMTPMSVQLGYRGKYQVWAIDVVARGLLGSDTAAPRRNPEGGHVDFDAGAALGLHFLRYTDPSGMNSFYFGGGAQFQLSLFSVIRPEEDRGGDDHESMIAGGMDADLIIGYEFMRASSVHFFVQAEVHLPTYRLETEVDAGGLDVWLPGGLAQIGVIF